MSTIAIKDWCDAFPVKAAEVMSLVTPHISEEDVASLKLVNKSFLDVIKSTNYREFLALNCAKKIIASLPGCAASYQREINFDIQTGRWWNKEITLAKKFLTIAAKNYFLTGLTKEIAKIYRSKSGEIDGWIVLCVRMEILNYARKEMKWLKCIKTSEWKV